MTRWIQVGLLSLLILLLTTQEGKAAPSKKPLSKDSEFNDPLLEEEIELEEEAVQEEQEALEARGNVPLEENLIPEPPPPADITADNHSNKDQDFSPKNAGEETAIVSPKSSPKLNGTINVEPQSNEVIVDQELGVMVNVGDEVISPRTSNNTAALPKWDPRDSRKGFTGIDDEGVYLYKESDVDHERQYKDAYKYVPKESNYKRGLLYVTSDGSYVYGGEASEKEGSASIRFAQIQPLPLENDYGFTFEDMYGGAPLPLILIDYDWLALRKFGQWILGVGTGLMQTEGPGRFADDLTEANERYTFYMVLNHISFSYRFQYSENPWVVPYVSGGVLPAFLAERRDDNKRNKVRFVPAAQGSGGVRLNIGKLDTYGAASLDAEYGINNMWLDVEFRRIQSFDETIDISGNLFNVGMGFDF